jgi:hypothetical protein
MSACKTLPCPEVTPQSAPEVRPPDEELDTSLGADTSNEARASQLPAAPPDDPSLLDAAASIEPGFDFSGTEPLQGAFDVMDDGELGFDYSKPLSEQGGFDPIADDRVCQSTPGLGGGSGMVCLEQSTVGRGGGEEASGSMTPVVTSLADRVGALVGRDEEGGASGSFFSHEQYGPDGAAGGIGLFNDKACTAGEDWCIEAQVAACSGTVKASEEETKFGGGCTGLGIAVSAGKENDPNDDREWGLRFGLSVGETAEVRHGETDKDGDGSLSERWGFDLGPVSADLEMEEGAKKKLRSKFLPTAMYDLVTGN